MPTINIHPDIDDIDNILRFFPNAKYQKKEKKDATQEIVFQKSTQQAKPRSECEEGDYLTEEQLYDSMGNNDAESAELAYLNIELIREYGDK